MSKEHKWHKTSHKLPEPMTGMVAGLWNEDDGDQIMEVCFYDTDDNIWCFGDGNYIRQPDYWIEIPAAKQTKV